MALCALRFAHSEKRGNMKKIILSLLLAVMLAGIPPGRDHTAYAGALIIDLTMSSSTAAATGDETSGDTIYQVSTTSGTYTTGLAAGDTVIPNLTNYGTTYSIQLDDITLGNGLAADDTNSEVTSVLVIQFSNINDGDHWVSWGGASEYVVSPSGVSLGGTSLYALQFDPGMFEYMRVLQRNSASAHTPFATAPVRIILK